MPGNYFLMKNVIKVSAQELIPKEKSLHHLSNSSCGATGLCCIWHAAPFALESQEK